MEEDEVAPAERRRDWSALGQLVGVIVVLLPALGAVSRFVAFTAEPTIRYPLRVAAAAPLPVLTATGLSLLLPIAFGYVVVLGLARSRRRERERRRRQLALYVEPAWFERVLLGLPRWARRPAVYVIVGGAITAVAILGLLPVIFFPAFPLILISYAAGMTCAIVSRAIERRTGSRLRVSTAWPILLVLLVYTLSVGGSAVELPHARYEFSPEVPLPAGPYLHLGDDGSRFFLWSCDRRETVVVRAEHVLLEEFLHRAETPTHPSLWDVVVNDRAVGWGLRLRCGG